MNYQSISRLAPKAFEFAESFSKQARLLLAGGLSKVVGAVMPAFQNRFFIDNLCARFRNRRD
jgi:hypothetical protein